MSAVHPPLDLESLRAAYRSGLTPRALMAELRRRALAANQDFHLFIHVLHEAELAPYLDALESRRPEELPLYGLPFAIKDNLDLAGVPTTAACPDYAYLPQRSATVVGRLLALGALPLGKTNLDQFATGLNGTRSPYGACRNSRLPQYPAGGSSSGSALAVALDLCSFALGSDTAGSGRVPAALNGLVGTKPSRGLISARGLVAACRSLDCVTLFTRSAAEASELLAHCAACDPEDAYSRPNPSWNARSAFGAVAAFRFGVPRARDLIWLGCTEGPGLFAAARARLEALGGTAVEIDFSPFLEAARLLYEGPWVAERYAAISELIERKPEALLPVIRAIIEPAVRLRALDLFRAQYRLQALKQRCDAVLAQLDCVLTPTIPRACTLAELEAEPILRNSELGTYTNFMNLLDYAAVAIPAGAQDDGLPWGVTLFGRCHTDQYLLALAHAFETRTPARGQRPAADRQRLVVCGAHLQGLPLNAQLGARGGRLVRATRSAPRYRLYALAGGPPLRPGMVRVGPGQGAAIAVEVWELPSVELGSLLAGVPAPLGLGQVELEDGGWETGFLCEPCGIAGAEDITAFGGWRAWLAARY